MIKYVQTVITHGRPVQLYDVVHQSADAAFEIAFAVPIDQAERLDGYARLAFKGPVEPSDRSLRQGARRRTPDDRPAGAPDLALSDPGISAASLGGKERDMGASKRGNGKTHKLAIALFELLDGSPVHTDRELSISLNEASAMFVRRAAESRRRKHAAPERENVISFPGAPARGARQKNTSPYGL